MASIISAGTTSGTSLNLSGDTSGVLQLASNGSTTAVTIDTSQNVGIGTANPDFGSYGAGERILGISNPTSGTRARLSFQNLSTSTSGISGTLAFFNGSTILGSIDVGADGATNKGYYAFYANDGASNSERMRIDSSGNVLVGTTTSLANGLTVAGGNGPQFSLNTTTRFTQINFYNSGNQKGFIAFDNTDTRLIIQNASAGVYLSSGATSWTSNSDERNKDIIEPITDAVNKVSTLRTVIGKYKSDAEGTRRPFLIAQDVQTVLPEAVEASNPNDLGVNYTDVIPLLVASIKELKAELDATKAEVQALKGTL